MATAAADGKIEIGRVIGRGFEALRTNLAAFFGLSLVFSGAVAFLMQLLMFEAIEGAQATFSLSPYYWGAMLLSFVSGAFVQAILVRSAILSLSGRPGDIGGSVMVALRLLPQLLGLTILVSLGVGIGLVLLIVPEIILYIMWVVAVPALVEERHGVIGSMQRSTELTKGSRGAIFALLVAWTLLVWGISLALTSLGGGIAAGSGSQMMWVSAGYQALLATLLALVNAALVASLYVELRTAKEGATADVLADIFA